MLTTIPFAGFYYSVHDQECDDALNQYFQNENGDPNEPLVARAFDMIDWRAMQEKYARAYVENFASEFKIKCEFESMQSPREYNFGTDRIFATIEESEVRRIFAATKPETLAEVARERFTSRSGFISHYSPDIEDWGDVAEWDHNQVGTVLLAYANQESESGKEFDSWEEVSLMESDRDNGHIEQWLGESVRPACAEDFARLDKVYAYLRERERRHWTIRNGA